MKRKIKDMTTLMVMFFLATSCHCFSSEDQPEVRSSQCDENFSPVACSINEFGFSLTKKIGGSGNFFFSPLSISVALAMTYLGARGKTAKQMENALGYRRQNLTSVEVQEGFRKLITSLHADGTEEYSLLVANGMFIQENFTVNEQFAEDIREIYQAVVNLVDFNTNGQNAVEEINRWVDQNTRSKIKTLFSEPLDPMTRLVLLNAIYFKGTWKIQFPKEATRRKIFTKSDGTTKYIKMMSIWEEYFRYFDDPETKYKFLELPYKGEHISMLLALPRDFYAPADIILTSDILSRVNQSMVKTELGEVLIPKFKMEYKSNLIRYLKALRIRRLFSRRADLSGIREARDLFVSKVIHKAVIEVNEEGSEAAAVSSVGFHFLSAKVNPPFLANRPFQFYIIDNRSGVVLFAGRFSDP